MNAALALLLFFALHNRSEGRSDFSLDDTGRVAITIQLSHLDLPELCNVDFSVADRAREERELEQCLQRNFSRWLRLRGDGLPCAAMFEGWREKSSTIILTANATCPHMPRSLVIDWGLFAGTPLDHVSVATIRQPHAKPRLAMLSKRAPKLTVDVARPLWPFLVAAAALVASSAVIAALIVRRRRRARG